MSNLQNDRFEDAVYDHLSEDDLASICYDDKSVFDYYEEGMKPKDVAKAIRRASEHNY